MNIPEYIQPNTLHCPKCNSTNLTARVLMEGYGTIKVNEPDVVTEKPEEVNFDVDQIQEVTCECDHFFEVEVYHAVLGLHYAITDDNLWM